MPHLLDHAAVEDGEGREVVAKRNGVTVRGTSNKNVSGSAEARRRRKVWLVETYRADRDLVQIWDVKNGADPEGPPTWSDSSYSGAGLVGLQEKWGRIAKWLPACRCYRCGCLLTVASVTVDRIIPGCQGGTYRRDNIRPACSGCNSLTGGRLKGKGKKP